MIVISRAQRGICCLAANKSRFLGLRHRIGVVIYYGKLNRKIAMSAFLGGPRRWRCRGADARPGSTDYPDLHRANDSSGWPAVCRAYLLDRCFISESRRCVVRLSDFRSGSMPHFSFFGNGHSDRNHQISRPQIAIDRYAGGRTCAARTLTGPVWLARDSRRDPLKEVAFLDVLRQARSTISIIRRGHGIGIFAKPPHYFTPRRNLYPL